MPPPCPLLWRPVPQVEVIVCISSCPCVASSPVPWLLCPLPWSPRASESCHLSKSPRFLFFHSHVSSDRGGRLPSKRGARVLLAEGQACSQQPLPALDSFAPTPAPASAIRRLEVMWQVPGTSVREREDGLGRARRASLHSLAQAELRGHVFPGDL